jgi:hypothetical protein
MKLEPKKGGKQASVEDVQLLLSTMYGQTEGAKLAKLEGATK